MFEQIKLSFASDALEPVIDAATVETHYGKHHAAYTKTFNELVEKKGAMADALVDGKINMDKGQLLDFLIG